LIDSTLHKIIDKSFIGKLKKQLTIYNKKASQINVRLFVLLFNEFKILRFFFTGNPQNIISFCKKAYINSFFS
jgi:hypothetical protein